MNLRVLTGSAVLGLVAALAAVTPAHADAPTLTGTTVYYFDSDCRSAAAQVSGLDSTTQHTVQVLGTDFDEQQYGPTIFVDPQFCPNVDDSGDYTVLVDSQVVGYIHVFGPHFIVRRVSNKVMRARLVVGEYYLDRTRVNFQVAQRGFWFDSFSERTDRRGWAYVHCKPHHRCHFYGRFAYEDFAYSRAFVLTR